MSNLHEWRVRVKVEKTQACTALTKLMLEVKVVTAAYYNYNAINTYTGSLLKIHGGQVCHKVILMSGYRVRSDIRKRL